MTTNVEVIVDTVAGPPERPDRVFLEVRYGEKICRLDLPVPESAFEGEPNIDRYQRELDAFFRAIEQWARGKNSIQADRPSGAVSSRA